MKATQSVKLFLTALITISFATITNAEPPRMKMTTDVPPGIATPDKLQTPTRHVEPLRRGSGQRDGSEGL